jgi:hypothetical protein
MPSTDGIIRTETKGVRQSDADDPCMKVRKESLACSIRHPDDKLEFCGEQIAKYKSCMADFNKSLKEKRKSNMW